MCDNLQSVTLEDLPEKKDTNNIQLFGYNILLMMFATFVKHFPRYWWTFTREYEGNSTTLQNGLSVKLYWHSPFFVRQ